MGAIFWNLRSSNSPQHELSDWLGYHVAMMGMCSIVQAAWAAEPALREKLAVTRDIRDGLYSRGLFYICKVKKIIDLIQR
jgi:hypothetical protein